MIEKQIKKVYQQILEFESVVQDFPEVKLDLKDFNKLSQALDKLYNCQFILSQKIDEESIQKEKEKEMQESVVDLSKEKDLIFANKLLS